MPVPPYRAFARLVLLAMLLGLAACAPQSRLLRAPVVGEGIMLDARASADSGARLVVTAAIVRNGPEAWVRDAQWDEYRVQVANDGPAPLRLTGFALASERLSPAEPTRDLDQLERGSSRALRAAQTAGLVVSVGYVAGSLAFVGAGGSQVALLAASSAAVIVMPVTMIAGGIYMHRKHRREREDRRLIQAEIDRRAPTLPLPLAPGEERSFSLFFPITPAPRALQLIHDAGGQAQTLVLELPALKDLHLRPAKAP